MMGCAVICPHANTAWMDGPQNHANEYGVVCGPGDSVFLDGDLEILGRCDALVLVGKWNKSEGAKEELRLALDLGLLRFDWPHDKDKLRRFISAAP